MQPNAGRLREAFAKNKTQQTWSLSLSAHPKFTTKIVALIFTEHKVHSCDSQFGGGVGRQLVAPASCDVMTLLRVIVSMTLTLALQSQESPILERSLSEPDLSVISDDASLLRQRKGKTREHELSFLCVVIQELGVTTFVQICFSRDVDVVLTKEILNRTVEL